MAKTQRNSEVKTEDLEDLSIDSNVFDPKSDRLGYAPFASHLADSICKMSFTGSYVIAVDGSWNFGKSTLLNFIVHYLKQKPESEQPIIVPFNPWVFSGDEDISKRFFDQVQRSLNRWKIVPKGFRDRIADVAKVVSQIPLPYAQAGNAVTTLFDDKQKDASDFKEDLETKLLQKHPRVVVTIDDVDRLDAQEIQKLFRVIKAFPNFTDVVYVIFFDKEIIIKALEEPQISGEEYLDKLVQIYFELPIPDKTLIRRLLFERLSTLLNDTPKQLFDQTYWGNVYFQGIDHFITTPADIYRLINNLSLTYPVAKGEVNSVDFIALETLRVFCPASYDIIHSNPKAFAGEVDTPGFTLEEIKSFHDSWTEQLQDEDKEPVKRLLSLIFPKLEAIWGSTYQVARQESTWRRQLPVCSLETFPNYFRLELPESELFNSELKTILASARDGKLFGENLVKLANQKYPDGTTQVRTFLERLEDYTEKEIPLDYIPSIVQALFDVGDQLLPPEDKPCGMFDFGNDVKIGRIVWQLLRRLDEPERFELLRKAMSNSNALLIIVREVANLGQQQGKYGADKPSPEEEWLISTEHFKELEAIALERVQYAVAQNSLVQTPDLPFILHYWRDWTSEEEVKQWVQKVISNDEGLVDFLEKFLEKNRSQSVSNAEQTIGYGLDLKQLEPYLEPASVIDRVKNIDDNIVSTQEQITAIKQFIEGYDMRQQGQDPDVTPTPTN